MNCDGLEKQLADEMEGRLQPQRGVAIRDPRLTRGTCPAACKVSGRKPQRRVGLWREDE